MNVHVFALRHPHVSSGRHHRLLGMKLGSLGRDQANANCLLFLRRRRAVQRGEGGHHQGDQPLAWAGAAQRQPRRGPGLWALLPHVALRSAHAQHHVVLLLRVSEPSARGCAATPCAPVQMRSVRCACRALLKQPCSAIRAAGGSTRLVKSGLIRLSVVR